MAYIEGAWDILSNGNTKWEGNLNVQATHVADDGRDRKHQMVRDKFQTLKVAAKRPKMGLRDCIVHHARAQVLVSQNQIVKSMRRSSRHSRSRGTSSRGSSPASVIMTAGLQTSKVFSILLETPRDEPRLALNEEEKQLIYSLAASFQSVTAILQSPTTDSYDRKEARRRLDVARRVLNGEELEGHPF